MKGKLIRTKSFIHLNNFKRGVGGGGVFFLHYLSMAELYCNSCHTGVIYAKKRADTRMFLPHVTVAIIEMRPSFVMLSGVEIKKCSRRTNAY
jgi:hypothetical protein